MTDKPVIKPIETKHLCLVWGIKGTALRRVLRSMDEYNDGQHTNYRWESFECDEVLAIKAKLDALAQKRVEAAEAAKAAMAERVAASQAREDAAKLVQDMLAAAKVAK